MKLFEKLKGWLGLSDGEKVQMDRRAFMKGMVVTSAGVLLPGATFIDMARALPPAPFPGSLMGLRVHCNGILLREGDDYTVDSNGDTFSIDARTGLYLPDDSITVDYDVTVKNPFGESKDMRVWQEVASPMVPTKQPFLREFSLSWRTPA